jgi:hypothetical protein
MLYNSAPADFSAGGIWKVVGKIRRAGGRKSHAPIIAINKLKATDRGSSLREPLDPGDQGNLIQEAE